MAATHASAYTNTNHDTILKEDPNVRKSVFQTNLFTSGASEFVRFDFAQQRVHVEHRLAVSIGHHLKRHRRVNETI